MHGGACLPHRRIHRGLRNRSKRSIHRARLIVDHPGDAEALPGSTFTLWPKSRHAVFRQRAENGVLLPASAPTWPHHTDTLGLSACLRFEWVDVLTQEAEGGLQDHVLHRAEWEKALSFALSECLLLGVVGV
jgi:hypothetical protein